MCMFLLRAALSLPLLGLAVGLSPEPAGILAYPDWVSRGFKVGTQLSPAAVVSRRVVGVKYISG